jgi:hypothetical protein
MAHKILRELVVKKHRYGIAGLEKVCHFASEKDDILQSELFDFGRR